MEEDEEIHISVISTAQLRALLLEQGTACCNVNDAIVRVHCIHYYGLWYVKSPESDTPKPRRPAR